ncbi:OmpA family protein [Haliangium sp.]|uniref:OmpA family protein n=1 Tax=Haliangium sp. TaxID=2663208 RepID=UPI003D152D73
MWFALLMAVSSGSVLAYADNGGNNLGEQDGEATAEAAQEGETNTGTGDGISPALDIGLKFWIGDAWLAQGKGLSGSPTMGSVEYSGTRSLGLSAFARFDFYDLYGERVTLGGQPEIGVVTRGARLDNAGAYLGTIRYSYLEVPLLARASVNDLGRLSPYALVGPALSLNLSAETENRDGGITDRKDSTEFFDLGLQVGIGTEVAITSRISAVAEVRYAHGLVAVDSDDNDLHQRAILFSLGATYDLRSRPPPDTDGDGIPDRDDPDSKLSEDKDCILDDDGVPGEDEDKDGVDDVYDRCPEEPGGGFFNGCPRKGNYRWIKQVTPERIELAEPFLYMHNEGQNELEESLVLVVRDIARVMVEDLPELEIRIDGHSANDGRSEEGTNIAVSERRARLVRDALVRLGIDARRMTVRGLGTSVPAADVEPGDTSLDAQRKNRRVEFYVIGGYSLREYPVSRCPDPVQGKDNQDADGDGIAGDNDVCPNEHGGGNFDGCPHDYRRIAWVSCESIELMFPPFELPKPDALQDNLLPVLDEIADMMIKVHPTLRIRIDGHAAKKSTKHGPRAENAAVKRSLEGAETVRDALIARGVEAERIQAEGRGTSKPAPGVEPDDISEQAQRKNQRVEFYVTDGTNCTSTPQPGPDGPAGTGQTQGGAGGSKPNPAPAANGESSRPKP